MALRRLSNSSIQTNGKSSKLWDQTTFQSGMFALATVNVTSTASSVVFSDIPSNYTHLQVRILGRGAAGSSNVVSVRVNNDTTNANYARHRLVADGNPPSASGGGGSLMQLGNLSGAGQQAGLMGVQIIDILDYSSTSKNKTFRSLSGLDTESSGVIWFASGLWMNTTAINRLDFLIGNDWASTSQIALYGIKAG